MCSELQQGNINEKIDINEGAITQLTSRVKFLKNAHNDKRLQQQQMEAEICLINTDNDRLKSEELQLTENICKLNSDNETLDNARKTVLDNSKGVEENTLKL